MPPVKQTDPDVIEQRKKRKASNHARYMRLWRQRGKQVAESMTNLLEGAVSNMSAPPEGLLGRGAVAALALTLANHGITVDRVARVCSEGLESVRDRKVGDVVVSTADMQHRLRSGDLALKLLERAGITPSARRVEPATHIVVNVMMMAENRKMEMKTIDTEESEEIDGTDSLSAGKDEDA
jgi:hypothetical protein